MKSGLGLAVVSVVLGLCVGAGGMALRSSSQIKETSARAALSEKEAAAAQSALQELEQAVEAAKNRIRTVEEQNMDLAMRVQELMKQAEGVRAGTVGSTGSQAGQEPGTNVRRQAFPPEMQELVRGQMKMQLDGRMSRLTERLGLSPEQAEKMRKILEEPMLRGMETALQSLGADGGLTQGGITLTTAENPEGSLQEVLSAEQWEAYEEFQKEEHQNTARLTANSELLQMQQMLGLDQGQQDALYEMLYDYNSEMMNSAWEGAAGRLVSEGGFEGVMQKKIERVEQSGILNESQMEQFRRQQQQQIEMVERMISQRQGN